MSRLKKLDFCSRKFLTMLPATTLGVLVIYIVMIIGIFISGSRYGEDGIAAINLVLPLFTFASFVALLAGKGTVVRFSYAKGEFKKKEADRIFGQGIILAVGFGVIMFLVALLGKSIFFDIMDPSLQIRLLAEEYYKPFPFILLFFPAFAVLTDTINADGDEITTMISNALFIVFGIFGSIVFFNIFGIIGISLGTLAGIVLAIPVLITHFFKKKNSLFFTWYINFKDAFATMKYGLTDGSKYLCSTFLIVFLNMFVIEKFGSEYLAMVALATSTIELATLFDAVGEAFNPMVSIFLGEKNNRGVRDVMKTALIVVLIESIVMTAIIMIFAEPIALLFGINGDVNLAPYALAIRMSAAAFVFIAVKFLLTSFYLLQNRFLLSVSMTFVSDLIVPLAVGISLASIINDMVGIWIGLIAAPLIAILYGYIVVALKYGRGRFPLILEPENDKNIMRMMLEINPENAALMSVTMATYLRKHKVCEKSVYAAELLVEELIVYLQSKNPKAKKLNMECTVMVREKAILILRYNGIVFDITKEDFSGEMVNAAFISACVKRQKDVKNITTQGYNRNEFRYSL